MNRRSISAVLRRVWLLAATASLLLTTQACTISRYYDGVPLQGDPVKLVHGQSTRSDVLREFGPPTQIMHQTNGDAFVYTYLRWNYSSLQLRDPITGTTWFTYTRQFENRDRLLVVFDFTGVVRDVAIDHRVQEMPAL